jgi:hypothetical protein
MSNSLDGEEQLFSHKDAHLADAASGVERVRILLAQRASSADLAGSGSKFASRRTGFAYFLDRFPFTRSASLFG